jgi:hypothetical protein
MADSAREDRIRALAKIDKLLAPKRVKSARRHEVERKQAAVVGQSRAADDECESLEALLAAVRAGVDAPRLEGMLCDRMQTLAGEAAQRQRRLMKLRVAANASSSDSSGSDEGGASVKNSRAEIAAAAVAAEAAAAGSAAEEGGRSAHSVKLKHALMAFVRAALAEPEPEPEPEPDPVEPAATAHAATHDAADEARAQRSQRLRRGDELPAALSPGGFMLDPEYWLGIVLPAGASNVFNVHSSVDERATPPPPDAAGTVDGERARDTLQRRGFLMSGISWPRDVEQVLDNLPALMEALVAAGWPPVFCFVFDEPWRMLASLIGWGEQILGDGVTIEPSVFAWRLQRQRAGFPGSNFGLPHRDYSHSEAHDSQGCRLLSVWVPLTDVGVDDGCMYVVCKDQDPDFATENYAHLRCATQRTDDEGKGKAVVSSETHAAKQKTVTELRFTVAGLRPLAPVPAKSVCAWAGNSIHFGAAASAHSRCPRVSVAVTLCAQRVDAVHGCAQLLSRDALLGLSLSQRLAFIFRSLLSHANWYDLDLPGIHGDAAVSNVECSG